MATLSGGLLGCFRCAYVWRPRRGAPSRICPRCKSCHWDAPKIRPIRIGHGAGISQILGPVRESIREAANLRGFEHIRVFGSVRRNEVTPRSDVDFLVARRPGASMLDRAGLEIDLEGLLGRTVDVVTDEGLHWLVRPQVLFEAVEL
ncbi:MAG: nucleotidyltransferase domain-containing protein [Thermoplasmata archaeon]|nr:nucleotidyltransferase domain-containing protein [Thermoplasmata archaeon]